MAKVIRTIFLFSLTVIGLQAFAENIVISDDGREVLLNADGSWQFVSRDRYATANDGQRYRLNPDGSWQLISGDFSEATQAQRSREGVSAEARIITTSPLQLLLSDVEIHRKKVKMLKSVRVETQTVFRLIVKNRSDQAVILSNETIETMKAGVKTGSSKGENFKVTDITFDKPELIPGDSVRLTIVSAGSPRWHSIQYVSVEFSAGALYNPSPVVLRKDMDEVVVRQTDKR